MITVTGTTVNLAVGSSYSDAGATAYDTVDGTITSSIVTVNPVNTAVVGTYTVTYNVSDASGNAATQKTRTVNVVPISPVVNNTQTFLTTASSSTSCVVSLTTSGSGGTLEFNKSTSTAVPTSGWQSSSTVTNLTRGTAYYLWARRATGYQDRTNSPLTPDFLVGDTGVNPSSTTIDYDDTTASTTIVTYGTVGETYAVRVNNGSTNLGTDVAVSSSSAGTATISFTGSLPTAGNSTTYEIFVLRPISTGGDGSTYYPTDDTFTVTRDALPISPVVNNTQTFLTTASSSTSCVVSLTSSGSGGTLEYNKSTSTTVPTGIWYSTSTVTNLTRGTAYYLWARQGTGYQDRTNSAVTVPFLVGDTGVNPSSSTITHDATAASTVVTYGTYGEAYSVRVNNGSTNLGATIANSVGTATISFTSSLPTAGNSTTYEIFVRRPTTTGGDESTYHPTNDTFTVTRSVQPDTGAPVITRLGNATVTLDAGGTYSDAGATAYDTVDGSITSSIVTVNPVNVNAAGTYTVTYNVSDAAGNAATQVTRSVTVSDRTPNAFNLVNPANATPGTLATSVAQQITGMDSGTPCSVSGQGSPQLQIGGGNNAWVTSSTINPNFYINVRLTASTSFNTTHTATLTIGTETDTIAVTSSADSSGGSGTPTDGGSGSYGIQVFDTDGSTRVISPSTRYMTRLVDPVSITVTAGNSILISCDMGVANTPSELKTSNSQVVFEGYMPVSQVPVTLESNGFRITNNSGQTISNVVYVTRF